MIKAFFANWGGAVRDAGRFASAMPLLVIAMIAVELLQHVVEVRLGMFSGDTHARAVAAAAPMRMLFGWPKMAVVFALGFLAIRWMVTRDATIVLRPSWVAVRRYTLVALFQAVIAVVIIYAEPIAAWSGAGKAGVLPLRLTAGLAQQLAEPLLFFWYVNAAMGTDDYGPVGSARVTGWWYFWGLLLLFVTRLPFNAAHQLLNRWPAGKGAALVWPALVVDAVVVAAMVSAIAAVQVRIARYIAERRGVGMLEE